MDIRKTIYRTLIQPRHTDEDIRNREIVLNALLACMLAILIGALLILGLRVATGSNNLDTRVASIAATALLVGSLYALSRRGWHRTASSLLIAIDFLLASALIYSWGIIVPTGILLYGLVIVLAGILLGAVYALYVAGAAVLTVTLLQVAAVRGIINSDWSWLTNPPGMTDVAGYTLLFAALALVVWLFNHQMARSLHKAERAEAELLKQKELLEVKVEERTRELQAAQLEKVQQMYRFAELGQLSTAMMHDLANHLTNLTINIESLEGEKRSKVLAEAKHSIHHIDDMVARVRDQLHGRASTKSFGVAAEISAVVKMLRPRAQRDGVDLVLEVPADGKQLRAQGDAIRFRQMIANLVMNGIDAYEGQRADPQTNHRVLVTADGSKAKIIITVQDWGRGIKPEDQKTLFEPFHSSKQTGMGMGLFIVKQIVEEHFVGTVRLDTSKKHTAFVVQLPREA